MEDMSENLLQDSNLRYRNLLTKDEIPEWCQDNEYIIKGYRKCEMDYKYYLKSIFQFHNETLNIWTHLIGALLFIGLGIYTFSNHIVTNYWGDFIAIGVFLFTVIFCFSASFIMHCWYPMSEETCNCLLKADYFGISLLILGSYGPFIYYAFYCQESIQWIYYIIVNILGLITIILTWLPVFHLPKYRGYRALSFALFISSVVCPIIHRIVLSPKNQNDFAIELEYYVLSLFLYLIGGFFFVKRYPENNYQNNCTMHFSSHKIFHFFTILGALVTYIGIIRTHKVSKNITCG
jgi:adiponectin receptor